MQQMSRLTITSSSSCQGTVDDGEFEAISDSQIHTGVNWVSYPSLSCYKTQWIVDHTKAIQQFGKSTLQQFRDTRTQLGLSCRLAPRTPNDNLHESTMTIPTHTTEHQWYLTKTICCTYSKLYTNLQNCTLPFEIWPIPYTSVQWAVVWVFSNIKCLGRILTDVYHTLLTYHIPSSTHTHAYTHVQSIQETQYSPCY